MAKIIISPNLLWEKWAVLYFPYSLDYRIHIHACWSCNSKTNDFMAQMLLFYSPKNLDDIHLPMGHQWDIPGTLLDGAFCSNLTQPITVIWLGDHQRLTQNSSLHIHQPTCQKWAREGEVFFEWFGAGAKASSLYMYILLPTVIISEIVFCCCLEIIPAADILHPRMSLSVIPPNTFRKQSGQKLIAAKKSSVVAIATIGEDMNQPPATFLSLFLSPSTSTSFPPQKREGSETRNRNWRLSRQEVGGACKGQLAYKVISHGIPTLPNTQSSCN